MARGKTAFPSPIRLARSGAAMCGIIGFHELDFDMLLLRSLQA